VTFRARLTLFFVGIVAAPLVVGAVVAAHASQQQAIRDADGRLQVAAVTATDALRLERARVAGSVSPAVALRAFRSPNAVDRIRRNERLDYLLVVGPGGPINASLDLPDGLDRTPAQIADGALRSIAAERTVVIDGTSARVIGGRLWRMNGPEALGVQTTLVLDGHPVGPATGALTTSTRPVTTGAIRLVCVCHGAGAAVSGVVLSTSVHAASLSRWFRWPAIGLGVLGFGVLVGLAYLLARVLTRPLARLAEEVAAVARGEPDVEPAVEPAAGRDLYRVATTLQTVSAELTGSRGELERTRGRLAAAERLTLIDPLTGAWNRRYLERAMREQVKRHERFGSPFALLVIDIDRFKRINDELGHAVGDAVLTEVAHTIDGSIRGDIDVLARFGGEEFVVVLPETDGPGGLVAADKIRELVADSAFESEGRLVGVTVSVGVAACPHDATDSERLLLAADAAMYRAKAAGRNRTVTAETPAARQSR
jgi:diguanylate cyclase (GGDEF)-like protein